MITFDRKYGKQALSEIHRVPALRRARAALADRRGMALIESALTIGIFFILLFGIIEVGRVLWTLNGLHLAAQQAARYIAIHHATNNCGSADNSTLQTFAAGYGGTGIPGTVYTLTQASGACATCGYQVTATYALQLYVPLIAMQPNLSATACFPPVI